MPPLTPPAVSRLALTLVVLASLAACQRQAPAAEPIRAVLTLVVGQTEGPMTL